MIKKISKIFVFCVLSFLLPGKTYALCDNSELANLKKLASNINVSYKISTILSWILAVLFAYFINKIYVFNKSEKDKIEFLKFIISRLLSLLIEFITMIILVDIFIINDRLSKLIVQVIVFILNYVFSKFIVFKK